MGVGSPIVGDLNQRTVTGHYMTVGDIAVIGTVTFDASTVLDDAGSDLVLLGQVFTATLDDTGTFSISLPVGDDPDITPTGWTYLVTERFDNATGRAPYHVLVPYDDGTTDPISIRTLISGEAGDVTDNGDGTETLSGDVTDAGNGLVNIPGTITDEGNGLVSF